MGSLIYPPIKKYFSEKSKMDRLRDSIISKSRIMSLSTKHLLDIEKASKIRAVALTHTFSRGGNDLFILNSNSEKLYQLAVKIQDAVQELAIILRKKSMTGALKIIFAKG